MQEEADVQFDGDIKLKLIIKMKLFFLIWNVIQLTVFAQSFTASVNNNKVGVNDRFEVSFTFSGKDVNALRNFNPPDFSNFLTLSGPNQSTSMQIINGVLSASRTYSFILQPRSIGKFTIGSASIEFDGQKFTTSPIQLEVTASSPQQQKRDDDASVSNEEIAQNLFIRASADKQRVVMGEQVTVTYKLYIRLNIASSMSISKLPKYQGFWVEELETSSNIMFSTEVVDGKQYRVGVLKRVALFPSQTGELSVTPFELKVPIQIQKKRRSQSLFDDFFGDPFGRYETIEFNARSNTLRVNVLPPPEANRPQSFKNAVGEFSISSSVGSQEVKTDEPVSLKIEISGTGNIKLLDIPEVNIPPGFDKYDPKVDEQISRSGRVSGKKTFEYLIVPRAAGKKIIPSVEFSFYNPARNQYVTLTTPEYTLNVSQGERKTDSEFADFRREGIRQLGEDIRFIKTASGSFNKKGEIVLHSIGFWTAVGLPLLAFIGLIAWKRRDEKLSADIQSLKYRKAEKIAKSRLKLAKKLMEENNYQQFYTEISAALFGYLEDKLSIPKSEFTLDRAVDELNKRKVENSIVERLSKNIEKCEFIRFAPGAGKEDMPPMYDELTNVIIDIERVLDGKKNV